MLCCSVANCVQFFFDPMDCSTLGFSVLHCLPEFAQTHVYWVNDGIHSIVKSVNINLSNFWEIVKDWETWGEQSMGSWRFGYDLVPEQQNNSVPTSQMSHLSSLHCDHFRLNLCINLTTKICSCFKKTIYSYFLQ